MRKLQNRTIEFEFKGAMHTAVASLKEDMIELVFHERFSNGEEGNIFIPIDNHVWYEEGAGPTALATSVGKALDELLASEEGAFTIHFSEDLGGGMTKHYTAEVIPKTKVGAAVEQCFEVWMMGQHEFTIAKQVDEKGNAKWQPVFSIYGTPEQTMVDTVGTQIGLYYNH